MRANAFKKLVGTFGVLIICSVLTSCTTTRAVSYVNYGNEGQPRGEYKFAAITANTLANPSSVLQRFYASYPSDRYRVIAIEKFTNNGTVILGTLGGLLGGGLIVGFDEDATVVAAPIGAIIGYAIGVFYRDKYVVTYIERQNEFGQRDNVSD